MDFSFVETEHFTRKAGAFFTNHEYQKLQMALIRKPDAGVLIPGGRGLRKLRWASGAKGKRGGLRILYYLFLSEHQIIMIDLFQKSEQSDLSPRELAILGEYVVKYLKR